MAQADAVHAVLAANPGIAIDGDRLTLIGTDGTELVFRVG